MRPILTPTEMDAVDAANAHRLDSLIDAAGAAVARAALRLLGGAYGRRVTVVAGPGNNGADGRVAAQRLRRRGARVDVFDAGDLPARLPAADLVLDAAFGTGLSRPWNPPAPGGPVLAVDLPSGLSGSTGLPLGRPWTAAATVTFAALKTGLLLGDAPIRTGPIEVCDIGLDVGPIDRLLVGDADVSSVPGRERDAHKWAAGVRVVAGSDGMTGAGRLVAAAAMRAGAGIVVASTPGVDVSWPTEVVGRRLPVAGWADEVLRDLDRFGALAIGPGLGTDVETLAEVRKLLARSPVPCVVDADGLAAVDAGVLADRSAPTVLTPHDGEFRRLIGSPPDADRFRAVVDAAGALHAVVLLKGPTTIVASPSGPVRVAVAGDARLATAGTGDVLTGVIAAIVARGVDAVDAAALGAHIHGRAGSLLPRAGAVASDLLSRLGAVMSCDTEHGPPRPERISWTA